MSEIIERVARAISAETHVWSRVDKTQALPFQVIDRKGEPIVLSSWATAAEQAIACRKEDSNRRARAAIEVMREPTEAMLAARDGAEMRAPLKKVGPGFAAFLSREMFCKASGCRWQWFAEREGHYVHCTACGSAYPWRDTYYLRRIYELEAERKR